MITPFKHPLTKDTPTREDFFNLVDVTSDDMNETLQYYYDLIFGPKWEETKHKDEDRFHTSSEWNFTNGPLDLWVQVPYQNRHIIISASAFPKPDTRPCNFELCEISVVNTVSHLAVRWFNPKYWDDYVEECVDKSIDYKIATPLISFQNIKDIGEFMKQAKIVAPFAQLTPTKLS
jgi:hypothetical protein